jgi:hypothetical protein
MIDRIRRDIQALLDELLGEIDKLRRALAALTSRGSEPDDGERTAPVASSASAGESAAQELSRERASDPADTQGFGAVAPGGADVCQPVRCSCPCADRPGRDQGRGPGRAAGRQRDDGR